MSPSTPIFVLGYMHSGTTLLQNILAANPDVYSCGGETKFFDYLPMIRKEYPSLEYEIDRRKFINFIGKTIHYGYWLPYQKVIAAHKFQRIQDLDEDEISQILGEISGQTDYGVIFRSIFDYFARQAGKSHWLEKTPTHVYHVDNIIKSIPDARFVIIVRDPRDILASKKTRTLSVWTTNRYTDKQKPIKALEILYNPVWDTLAWQAAARSSANSYDRYTSQMYMLKYEDLVQTPDIQIRKLCEFLNLTYYESMVDVPSGIPAEWKSNNRDERGIKSEYVGRWKNVLDNPELATCQFLVKHEMKFLDYKLHPIHWIYNLTIPFIIVNALFELIYRLYTRLRLGGFNYLLLVLQNYIKRLVKIFN